MPAETPAAVMTGDDGAVLDPAFGDGGCGTEFASEWQPGGPAHNAALRATRSGPEPVLAYTASEVDPIAGVRRRELPGTSDTGCSQGAATRHGDARFEEIRQ